MTRMTCTALALAALACGGGPRLRTTGKGEKVLEVRGDIEDAPIVLGAEDLARLPRRTVRGRDPASGHEAAWEGASLAAMLQRVTPKKKVVVDTLVVRTRDGEAVPIPVTFVWQYKPVLVPADGQPAALLAWPNLDQRGLDSDSRAPAWWARGVVALELVSWPRAFGAALAPPIGSSAAARVGSGLFASRCLSCHSVRGAGGTAGPQLTLAAASLDPARFGAALTAHRFERRGVESPDAAQRAQLYAFLQAVARAPKAEPDWDEAPAPPIPAPAGS